MSAFFSQIMKGSRIVWIIYGILFILSCTVTFSAMSKLALDGTSVSAPFLRHVMFLFVGVAVILVIQIVDFRIIKPLSFAYLIFAVAILGYVSVTGGNVSTGNASRFSAIGQPSEYVKFGLILVLAEIIVFVKKQEVFPTRFFYITMLIIAGILLLIFLENLSSAVIIASIVIVMLLFGGIGIWRVSKMVLIAGFFVTCIIGFAYLFPENKYKVMVEDYPALRFIDRAYTWKGRLDRHFNQEEIGISDDHILVTDKNRQEVYAKVAVCRGGWLPSGPGSSLQRNYLPEAFSDYVFAIAAEEGGFLLGLLIVIVYLTLFLVSLHYIIFKEQKSYRKLVLLGCAFSITFQAAVHIAVSVGAMPVTGQTLPLVSRGGASLVVVSAMFGMIIKITAGQSEAKKNKHQVEPQPITAENATNVATVEDSTDIITEPIEKHLSDDELEIIINEPSVSDDSQTNQTDDDDSIIIFEE